VQLDFLGDLKRTHTCGELRPQNAGQSATLMGWVDRRRDLGGVIFLDLRDRTGVTQIVIDVSENAELHAKAEALRSEYVIAVTGPVRLRSAETVNPNLETGGVELLAADMKLLNTSKLPPFLPSDPGPINEETRLKFRYIDLRRPEMQRNIELHHKVSLAIRDYLNSRGFFEIETPYMARTTPEGARDYLVPSRVHPGEFYALPQSPQLFKQLLMVGGFERYFQIARCFRDEDLRADRQPEFTQIDLEMSFPQEETLFEIVEGYLREAFRVGGFEVAGSFPRLTYDEAIRLYGSDKPDLRLPAMADVHAIFDDDAKQQLGIEPTLPFVVIRIPRVGALSRKERDDHKLLLNPRIAHHIKFFDDFRRLEKGWPEMIAKVKELVGAQEDDLLVLAAAPKLTHAVKPRKLASLAARTSTTAGQLRLALAQKYADRHKAFEGTDFKFLWVTDFPMFEWDETDGRWMAAHHPFTSPHEQDLPKLEGGLEAARDENSALGEIRSRAYDVVLNGTELGSGSIRIHRQDIQSLIFAAIGMDEEEQKKRFGFFLEALQYGTPPHGGIALGLDRIVMLMAGAASLREVIAFPKTAAATDLMQECPTPASPAQLRELGLQLHKPVDLK
jgi:aspartyl-tRNA synthetase